MKTFIKILISCFSTPKGFGPIVTHVLFVVENNTIMIVGTEFQYPEGFWPDSDKQASVLERLDYTIVSVPRRVLAR